MNKLLSSIFSSKDDAVAPVPVQLLSGRVERCRMFYQDENHFGLTILLVGADQPIRLQGILFTLQNFYELTQEGDEVSIGVSEDNFFCLDTFENATLIERLSQQHYG